MVDDRQPVDGTSVTAPGKTAVDTTWQLLARARAGDPQALERLFARLLPPLQRWARGRLPKWARQMTETDDLVQDALAQTFRRLDHVEANSVGALGGYLRQAVLNRIRDELRRSGRTPPSVDLDTVDLAGGQSPLEQAIGREGVERYERALQQLNPGDRDAIVGRLELGYSYEELAEALGKPSAEAARKAAQRALLKLADELRR
jgi:RNA polymerase sigma-70 factor (ECF subfamily)